MTPQEEQLLNSLVERVNQTQLQEKDLDAESLLKSKLAANPDALYMLSQTVLVQNIALEQAQQQLAQAKQQLTQAQQQLAQAQQQIAQQQPAHATSFLGGLLGLHDAAPAPVAAPAPTQSQNQPQAPPYQPVYAPAAAPQPAYAQPQFIPAAQPSFLRGAMQTAAGVAAGALAFEGVEAVLHSLGGGFGGGGYGYGGGLMGGGFGGPGLMGSGFNRPEETIINNNYYDQPGSSPNFEGGHEHHFTESADQGGAQLSDAGYNSTEADQSGQYDNNSNDSRQDDVAGLDDSGGFDDGGGFGGDSGGDFS